MLHPLGVRSTHLPVRLWNAWRDRDVQVSDVQATLSPMVPMIRYLVAFTTAGNIYYDMKGRDGKRGFLQNN